MSREKTCENCGKKFTPSKHINPDPEKQTWCGECIAQSFKGVYDIARDMNIR